MTTYAKRKLKYSPNENFNLLHYVEWDRSVTLARKLFLVRHDTLRRLVIGYGSECQIWKTFTTMFTAINPNKDISKTRQVHVK
jgi:hypothetical protein